MYTLEEIATLRQKCIALELDGREVLEKYSDRDLQKICNGIGPIVLQRALTADEVESL